MFKRYSDQIEASSETKMQRPQEKGQNQNHFETIMGIVSVHIYLSLTVSGQP